MLTGNKDCDRIILSFVDNPDILSYSMLNSEAKKSTDDEVLWMNKVIEEHGKYYADLKPKGKKWKDYYSKAIVPVKVVEHDLLRLSDQHMSITEDYIRDYMELFYEIAEENLDFNKLKIFIGGIVFRCQEFSNAIMIRSIVLSQGYIFNEFPNYYNDIGDTECWTDYPHARYKAIQNMPAIYINQFCSRRTNKGQEINQEIVNREIMDRVMDRDIEQIERRILEREIQERDEEMEREIDNKIVNNEDNNEMEYEDGGINAIAIDGNDNLFRVLENNFIVQRLDNNFLVVLSVLDNGVRRELTAEEMQMARNLGLLTLNN